MKLRLLKIRKLLCLALAACLCLAAAGVSAEGTEAADPYEQENARFSLTADEIKGPYYAWTEETDQISFNRCQSIISSQDDDPLIDAEITWKSGDEWLKDIITVEGERLADGSYYCWTSVKADAFTQTGSAVFTLKLVWKKYSREEDVEMRVLPLPPDAIRLFMPEIDMNIDDDTLSFSQYEFGTEKNVWSQLQRCFEVSPEIEQDWSACIDTGNESRWYTPQDGIETGWSTLTVTKPGIYEIVAEKTVGNLVFHLPVRVLARGKATSETDGDYEYLLWEDGTADITAYNGTETEIRIPETLGGHPVYSIGVNTVDGTEFPFRGNETLTRVEIPGSIKQITWIAFCGCTNLKEVVMEEGVRTIGQEAFSDCTRLSRVVIPSSVTEIEQMAFFNCPELGDIEVAEGNPRFATYRHLLYDKQAKEILHACEASIGESFDVPEGTRIIGIGAFCMNEKLKAVTLPGTLREIEYYAFADCTALEEIAVPEGVYSIGTVAFIRCENLKKATLPSTIRSISNDAFDDTSSELNITVRNEYAQKYCAENGIHCFLEMIPDALDPAGKGDIVTLGRWEQDGKTENGAEPIEWIVLAAENGKALLISKYCLDAQPFDQSLKDKSWALCSLRRWLNGDFLQSAFSEEEQLMLISMHEINQSGARKKYSSMPYDSPDRVIVPDIEEQNFFADTREDRLAAGATPYAASKASPEVIEKPDAVLYWVHFTLDPDNPQSVLTDGPSYTYGLPEATGLVRPMIWVRMREN